MEEDVGYGLFPTALIGNIIGVSTPIIDVLINLASEANHFDHWRQGRTLEKMDIARLSSVE